MSLRITMAALAVLTAAAGLAGCGKMGELERPGPLFGKAKAPAGASTTTRSTEDPSRPIQTIDPRNRDTQMNPGPQRSDPIAGTQDPTRAGPQGTLPDPFAHPQ